MKSSNEALCGVAAAAARLGVGRKSVARHFPTVRIGRRVLVRVADVDAKIAEGQASGAR